MIDTVIHGDALIELRKLEDNSLDALVCDPPAGINFMNKSFDSDRGGRDAWITWLTDIMQEVYRVLKPGAHGLVWALPRTSHWTATALEDAGFEIRDSIYHLYSKHDKLQAFMTSLSDEQRTVFETLMEEDALKLHLFGSGFPKSLDVSKQLDKLAGAEREIIGVDYAFLRRNPHTAPIDVTYNKGHKDGIEAAKITAPATPLAQQYSGYGSALKPACEVWWLIRKPLSESSIAKNVLKWGTGAINIDATRIETNWNTDPNKRGWQGGHHINETSMFGFTNTPEPISKPHTQGRWPSHLLMSHTLLCNDEQCADDCPIAILDAQSGIRKGHRNKVSDNRSQVNGSVALHDTCSLGMRTPENSYNDQGGASRYFAQFRPDPPFIYAPKASRRERNAGCEALPERDRREKVDWGKRIGGSGECEKRLDKPQMRLRSDLTPEQRDYVMKELAKK